MRVAARGCLISLSKHKILSHLPTSYSEDEMQARMPLRKVAIGLALACSAAVLVPSGPAIAYGPFSFCNGDGSQHAYNPGTAACADSSNHSNMQSVHVQVDTGTTASLCAGLYTSSNTNYLGYLDCSNNGAGSTAAVSIGPCGIYGHGYSRGRSDNLYAFHGHGWYYTYGPTAGC